MRIINLTIALLLAVFCQTFAQTGENAILGKWESDKKDVRLEFYKAGNEYQARLLWGNKVVESDGVTSRKDTKNPDEKLRSRNILGITSVTGLTWDGNEFTGGKIYNPPSGDTYKCKVWLEKGKLNLRGYMGVSMFGQTATFHRL
ncbi:uncharacterized protein (DUF2147 family) [Dyadobacter sp. BE34]|uniref:Uncharacterized protein (DUF2147 family) n=1 Tax=Dyadobacter fermentans TaxID=94254 RepID=A0ABU1QTX6_9BACT|nr:MULTISPECIES: DUF2147 domain-containing protein [Dyadobacter]MDR6804599.1 uncharacterized protein (DUF2147 family) [Dyadobacter fermentans]MDR7043642.1 uncharacterized protein (DUF2147 family) [Dyadobacter sp. BE242]MDR7197954.1 uncharacterized protein (DUF2147 family) [Dyadobacter sp. BE34]MDR7214613.1 uncharacterized protein (DUF2147 family) [Dyadobacter sp. BE31]MDR7262148.1 uncharacterized protein (DUF2147 family) [Dyadobacter sp. BE32]